MAEAGHDDDGKTELLVDGFLNIWFVKVLLCRSVTVTYLRVQDSLQYPRKHMLMQNIKVNRNRA